MEKIWKVTGDKPKELVEQPECPRDIAYLWEWFWQLPHPFNFTELHFWSQLTRRNLRAWEAEVLSDLQRVWV
ncbi:phage tail assembly chaperone [Pseudomonas citronellolis]|uniref:phage tail assembly chaperone n=1 Tax=Pseudomonas citronellolis TaxID=53408 RepID=UPI003B97FB01